MTCTTVPNAACKTPESCRKFGCAEGNAKFAREFTQARIREQDIYELPHVLHYRGIVGYLRIKVEQRDWHGVADAANDLREMEAAYPVLKGAKL